MLRMTVVLGTLRACLEENYLTRPRTRSSNPVPSSGESLQTFSSSRAATAMRVGIATGLVVVGGEVVEHDVAGDTPNLAARLQALAEPDAVVIAASTRGLTGDLFEYRDLGEIELKGIAAPVSAWQALRPSAVASRFEALRGSALFSGWLRGERGHCSMVRVPHWLPPTDWPRCAISGLAKTDLAFALGLLPRMKIGLRHLVAHSEDFADP
jgi:hypothetical protein